MFDDTDCDAGLDHDRLSGPFSPQPRLLGQT